VFFDVDMFDHIDQQLRFCWVHIFRSVIPSASPRSREIPWKSSPR
jgi:hypothetical protein